MNKQDWLHFQFFGGKESLTILTIKQFWLYPVLEENLIQQTELSSNIEKNTNNSISTRKAIFIEYVLYCGDFVR